LISKTQIKMKNLNLIMVQVLILFSCNLVKPLYHGYHSHSGSTAGQERAIKVANCPEEKTKNTQMGANGINVPASRERFVLSGDTINSNPHQDQRMKVLSEDRFGNQNKTNTTQHGTNRRVPK